MANWDVFHADRLELERGLTTEAVRAGLARASSATTTWSARRARRPLGPPRPTSPSCWPPAAAGRPSRRRPRPGLQPIAGPRAIRVPARSLQDFEEIQSDLERGHSARRVARQPTELPEPRPRRTSPSPSSTPEPHARAVARPATDRPSPGIWTTMSEEDEDRRGSRSWNRRSSDMRSSADEERPGATSRRSTRSLRHGPSTTRSRSPRTRTGPTSLGPTGIGLRRSRPRLAGRRRRPAPAAWRCRSSARATATMDGPATVEDDEDEDGLHPVPRRGPRRSRSSTWRRWSTSPSSSSCSSW